MTACDRFEQEGVRQLEQGVQLDAHFSTCADCLRAHARFLEGIAEIIEQVPQMDIDLEPSPGWRAPVWARVELLGGWQWARWLAPVGALAAIVVLSVLVGGPSLLRSRLLLEPSVVSEVRSGQTTVMRGQNAHPGDELIVRAITAGYEYAELRVYFNDATLELSCSTQLPCARQGATLSATVVMTSLGTYRPVLVVSNETIPEPSGNLDQDAGTALDAGALVRTGEQVSVR